jgi:plastocyanin
MYESAVHFRFARRAAIALSAAVLAIGLAACGSDDSTEGSVAATDATTEASADTVDVSAIEWEFDLSATPTADTKTVNFTNNGEQPHVLVFAKLNDGYTVDEAVKLQGKKGSAEEVGTVDAAPGETATIDVKKPLEPGHYVMLCPLSGPDGPHYKLGQLQEFEIG